MYTIVQAQFFSSALFKLQKISLNVHLNHVEKV